MSFKAIRIFVFCLIAVGGTAYYFAHNVGLAQQGGLTPPPKPSDVKTERIGNASSDASGIVVGERLSYNVAWASFGTAARLETEVIERGAYFGQEGYQIRTKVETASSAVIFEIYNQYTSYLSVKTLQPYRVESSTRQGSKSGEETAVFDQSQKEIRFADQGTLPLSGDTYDLTSLLYVLRQRPLNDGATANFNVYFGKQIYEVETEVKKRERVVSQMGSYNAIRVDINPKGKSKYRTRVWFSDDAQHLPVVIWAQMPFGDVRAELTNATFAQRSQRSPIATDENKIVSETANANNATRQNRALPFDLGERLNYDIAWGNFTQVGKASFEIRQKGQSDDGARPMLEFAGEAASIGAARSLMAVNDQLVSFVDANSLLPLKTETRLREGRRNKQVTCNYDWGQKLATLTNTTKITLPNNTLDLLSLFYAVRAERLQVGDFYRYSFLDANHRLHGVTVKANKTEIIGGALGSRETVQLDILTPNQQQLVAQAWVTNDARHLPLYFATRTRFGELRFQLVNASNTR